MDDAAIKAACGIKCPNCGCCDLPVKNTVPKSNNRICRYRECRNCSRRIPTYEVIKPEIKL